MENEIELLNFELSSWSHRELLVAILSMNLSSKVAWNIFVSFSQKEYLIFMNYEDLITSGNKELQATT